MTLLSMAIVAKILAVASSYKYKYSTYYRSRSRGFDVPSTYNLLRMLDDDNRLVAYKEVDNQPKFIVKGDVSPPKIPANVGSEKFNKKSTTFGSLTLEDLRKRMINLENSEGKPLPKKTEDLNGINPLTPLVFSTVPFAMAFVGYKLSAYLTANFAVSYLTSDIYTLQRAAIVARNLVVGMTTLATAFCGVIGIGLFLLGIAVGVGVLKGELDPNKKDISRADSPPMV